MVNREGEGVNVGRVGGGGGGGVGKLYDVSLHLKVCGPDPY